MEVRVWSAIDDDGCIHLRNPWHTVNKCRSTCRDNA